MEYVSFADQYHAPSLTDVRLEQKKSCTIFSLETFFQNSCANCIDIQNFSCILLHIKARALRDDRGALFFM